MIKTKYRIKKVIEELEQMLIEAQRDVERKISMDAPQSYCDDMNGCARGISIATGKTIRFLKEKLL